MDSEHSGNQSLVCSDFWRTCLRVPALARPPGRKGQAKKINFKSFLILNYFFNQPDMLPPLSGLASDALRFGRSIGRISLKNNSMINFFIQFSNRSLLVRVLVRKGFHLCLRRTAQKSKSAV